MEPPTKGDQVLVDTSLYGVDGSNWCEVVHIASGTASTYPVKVEIPGGREGQYKMTEILDTRDREPA